MSKRKPCEKCRFWEKAGEKQLGNVSEGYCHKMPAPWRLVRADGWCGMFKRRRWWHG